MKVHLPREWGSAAPACGVMAPGDETVGHPNNAEEVTCPDCAALVIGFTLSDVRKSGC